ncbi:MAG TPA: alginate export family protein, partial [Verrucomicrobiaceae bacterium]
NLQNPAVSFSVQPTDKLKVKLDYNVFWLANTHDFWYRANGVTPVRPISPNADSFVGSELDLGVAWMITKNVTLGAGYGHFFDGSYAKATGPASDADFAYAQLAIKF